MFRRYLFTVKNVLLFISLFSVGVNCFGSDTEENFKYLEIEFYKIKKNVNSKNLSKNDKDIINKAAELLKINSLSSSTNSIKSEEGEENNQISNIREEIIKKDSGGFVSEKIEEVTIGNEVISDEYEKLTNDDSKMEEVKPMGGNEVVSDDDEKFELTEEDYSNVADLAFTNVCDYFECKKVKYAEDAINDIINYIKNKKLAADGIKSSPCDFQRAFGSACCFLSFDVLNSNKDELLLSELKSENDFRKNGLLVLKRIKENIEVDYLINMLGGSYD